MNKILVAYFSHSGNTAEIAKLIHKKVGGDIFEIQPIETYPDDYNSVVRKAKQELESGFKPKLKTKLDDVKSYNLIFIGYPNWWSTMPMPVVAFLSEYDFSGKTIMPFCTHEGSRLGRSESDIAGLCPKSTIMQGLAVRGSSAKLAQREVSEWLAITDIEK